MPVKEEMVLVPKALLAEVLNTAEINIEAVAAEFNVNEQDRAATKADQEKVDRLRTIAGIPIE